MNKCNDYWCDYYGKGSEKCDLCKEKDVVKDSPELRVILNRRAFEQMELDNNTSSIEDKNREKVIIKNR